MDAAGSFPLENSRAVPRSSSAGRSTRALRSSVAKRSPAQQTLSRRRSRIAAAAPLGGMSEWLKETGCKPVGYAYAGSNPAPPIARRKRKRLHAAARPPRLVLLLPRRRLHLARLEIAPLHDRAAVHRVPVRRL